MGQPKPKVIKKILKYAQCALHKDEKKMKCNINLKINTILCLFITISIIMSNNVFL